MTNKGEWPKSNLGLKLLSPRGQKILQSSVAKTPLEMLGRSQVADHAIWCLESEQNYKSEPSGQWRQLGVGSKDASGGLQLFKLSPDLKISGSLFGSEREGSPRAWFTLKELGRSH